VIKNFSRNFDFGEMQVSADFTSGPEGHARADVRTMFTQVRVNTSISTRIAIATFRIEWFTRKRCSSLAASYW